MKVLAFIIALCISIPCIAQKFQRGHIILEVGSEKKEGQVKYDVSSMKTNDIAFYGPSDERPLSYNPRLVREFYLTRYDARFLSVHDTTRKEYFFAEVMIE